MVLSEFQNEWCRSLIETLASFETAKALLASLSGDPTNPGSAESIKDPMDLNLVLRKLSANSYSSTREVKSDVDLIWFNARIASEEGSPLCLIADSLERWFAKRFERIPHTEMENWMLQFQKVQQAAKALAATAPGRTD
jgi:hypothetical protein